MRILIVDDDAVCRLVMQTVLAGVGDVDSCNDGVQAVEAFREAIQCGRPYDLVCLDITMPNLDGLGALELIRQEEEQRQVPSNAAARIIMTTALGDSETVGSAFRNLCDAYLVKPILPLELKSLVEYLCAQEAPAAGSENRAARHR